MARRRKTTALAVQRPQMMSVNYGVDPMGNKSIKWRATTQQVIIAGAFGLAALGILANKINDQKLKEEINLVKGHISSPEFKTKLIEAQKKRVL